MNRYDYESPCAGQPQYRIIDRERGHKEPMAKTWSRDDAERIVEALNRGQ